MPLTPAALPEGTLLSERFLLKRVLGRGGFSIAYLAEDLQRRDECVVKELAPTSARREPDGMLDLGDPSAAQHLRNRFLEEARTLNALRLRGVLPPRQTFVELGTAYFVTDHLPNAETLEDVLRREHRLDADGALDVLMQLLEILEAVHAKGILHRDLKPSNVLIDRRGEVTLIDFGAAREWHADAAERHTVLLTPGYAAPEQHSERARRGPATDLYGLCATAFHMLLGEPPPTATERAAGVPLPSLLSLRPDLETSVAKALEAGLELRYEDRPAGVRELRALLSHAAQENDARTPLERLDATRLELRSFSFDRRQCPACRGLLESPKPLRRNTCPVCHEATIVRREIPERLCPSCKAGALRRRGDGKRLVVCPICRIGMLATRRKGLLGAAGQRCEGCSAEFEVHKDVLLHVASGEALSVGEWQARSGRSAAVWCCDGCDAQYDELPDGRRKQMHPLSKGWVVLYPDEWARVAAGLDPGAGNAECPACFAEYFIEAGSATLLSFVRDPYGFGRDNLGRHHSLERLRWLGVGKESPSPGFVCGDCGAEFDQDGPFLRLVSSRNARLASATGEPRTLGDWHRVARGLPTVAEEEAFEAQFDAAVLTGYRCGELALDSRNTTLLWRGPARRLEQVGEVWEDGPSGTLVVDEQEVSFGGVLRRWRVPRDAVLSVHAREDVLQFGISGEREVVAFSLSPLAFDAEFRSGTRRLTLTAEDLAERMRS